LQELLLPTPTNLNPIHVPRSDLLQFLRVQQWVEANIRVKLPLPKNGAFELVYAGNLQQQQCSDSIPMKLPLLNGMFVLVPAANLRQQQCSDSIPWRLRQIASVEVVPNGDPADATVVLVGPGLDKDRVRAGAVREGLLSEVQDYQVGRVHDRGQCPAFSNSSFCLWT
jgi:hypothetical protein